MNGKQQGRQCRLAAAALGIFLSLPALSAQTGDTVKYSFTGTMVLSTPCSVNGDQPVTVTFGNVGISKIDSGKYVQALDYRLNCGGATSTSRVSLTVRATPAAWDAKAIATSVDGLGAQILRDGEPLALNTSVDVPDPSSPPVLQVKLVKDSSVTLTEQAFTAAGTLIADYE